MMRLVTTREDFFCLWGKPSTVSRHLGRLIMFHPPWVWGSGGTVVPPESRGGRGVRWALHLSLVGQPG